MKAFCIYAQSFRFCGANLGGDLMMRKKLWVQRVQQLRRTGLGVALTLSPQWESDLAENNYCYYNNHSLRLTANETLDVAQNGKKAS